MPREKCSIVPLSPASAIRALRDAASGTFSGSLYCMRMLQLLLLCVLYVHNGNAFAHAGHDEQLLRINRAIEQQPDDQALYIRRGSIYSENRQFDDAIANFEHAEQLGPAVLVAFERGILYYRMGDFERATEYFDQYLEQFPQAAHGYEYRAWAARDTGNYQQAIADLNSYFDLLEAPHPGNYIAAANMLHDMQQTGQALQLLDKGMEKIGLTPQLQRRAIELELERGQVSNAIARQDSLRKPLNANPLWKLQMAELLLQDNRDEEARKMAQQAETELLELRPTPARLQQLQRARELLKPSSNS
jgi:tetratricopeptide (TPR) repeat protein